MAGQVTGTARVRVRACLSARRVRNECRFSVQRRLGMVIGEVKRRG